MASCCASAPEPEKPLRHSELSVRWLMLALLCASLIGNYYAVRARALLSARAHAIS